MSMTMSRITRGERKRAREKESTSARATRTRRFAIALVCPLARPSVRPSVQPTDRPTDRPLCPTRAHALVFAHRDRAPMYLPRGVPCSMARQHAVERPRVELAAEMRPNSLLRCEPRLVSLLSSHRAPLHAPSLRPALRMPLDVLLPPRPRLASNIIVYLLSASAVARTRARASLAL